MPETEKKVSIKPLVIIGIAAFLLLIYAVLNISPNPASDNASISTADPINPGNEVKIISSNSALSAINEAALGWAEDVQFISCNGSATIAIDKAVFGFNNGKFANWNCFIYSKSLAKDTTVSWKNDIATVKEPHISYTGAVYEINPDDRIYFNALDFESSDKAFETALNNGFDIDNNFPGISFGSFSVRDQFANQPVWELREFSKENPENEVRVYYIDALTNELLSVTNSN